MKKNLFIAGLVILFSVISPVSFAQVADDEISTPVRTPKWASKKGYWVVESNLHNPTVSKLYFYNNDNLLLYTEEVDGVVINLQKKNQNET